MSGCFAIVENETEYAFVEPVLYFCGSSRPSISPRLGSTSNVLKTSPQSQLHQTPLSVSVSEDVGSRPVISTALKRTRSPLPSFSASETFKGNSASLEDNSEQ